ncbi:unnamed protein product [Arctia plantaginis]|uniref:Beta-1,4-N-acetylgalactosaminyltransferase n=1 Tax=Arctia plantaginis TaxID=874455 RepID=A0A8S0YWT3_ARCPL|nr:unnamed protein product [Arctia plantaginis]
MFKSALINRLLQLRVSTCVGAILCVIAVLQFFTSYGVYNYSHLAPEVIDIQLFKQITPKLHIHKTKPDCNYDEILNNKETVDPWEVPKKIEHFSAKGVDNGSFVPAHCNPLFSVAVLVTYRNRQKQLDVFLPYMHNFLRKQGIHYKIYLIEQQDNKPFNRGFLYNIGVKQAINDKFPCLILHDVDLLPLDASNLYACTNDPRHMSASIDKFRYVLLYDRLVGGALAIRADQYVAVNGFSNRFEGWGGEDDDLASRLSSHQLNVVRFPREMSRYTMLVHRPEPKNSQRYNIIAENEQKAGVDGLSAMPYHHTRVKNHKMFTLGIVNL